MTCIIEAGSFEVGFFEFQCFYFPRTVDVWGFRLRGKNHHFSWYSWLHTPICWCDRINIAFALTRPPDVSSPYSFGSQCVDFFLNLDFGFEKCVKGGWDLCSAGCWRLCLQGKFSIQTPFRNSFLTWLHSAVRCLCMFSCIIVLTSDLVPSVHKF